MASAVGPFAVAVACLFDIHPLKEARRAEAWHPDLRFVSTLASEDIIGERLGDELRPKTVAVWVSERQPALRFRAKAKPWVGVVKTKSRERLIGPLTKIGRFHYGKERAFRRGRFPGGGRQDSAKARPNFGEPLCGERLSGLEIQAVVDQDLCVTPAVGLGKFRSSQLVALASWEVWDGRLDLPA